jgi:hypothetical protein
MQLHKGQPAGQAPPPVPLSGPDVEDAAVGRVVVGQCRGSELAGDTLAEHVTRATESVTAKVLYLIRFGRDRESERPASPVIDRPRQ